MMIEYNKLVRDKIPEIIENNGEKPNTRVAEDNEYWEKLKHKLQEEVDEFLESDDPEEIADILEVLRSICDFREFHDVEDRRKRKAEERGSFKEKIILDSVE